MAHNALAKLFEENKWRPIPESDEDAAERGIDYPPSDTELLLRHKEFAGQDREGHWKLYVGEQHNTRGGWVDGHAKDFRPLPDDRLALVAECLDDGYQTIIKHFPEAEVLVNKIREKATAIAEGKE